MDFEMEKQLSVQIFTSGFINRLDFEERGHTITTFLSLYGSFIIH